MTFDQFANGLRVLLNIDGAEFLRAVYGPRHSIGDVRHGQHSDWESFRDDPHRWFIAAPDAKAQAVWKIVAERTEGANHDHPNPTSRERGDAGRGGGSHAMVLRGRRSRRWCGMEVEIGEDNPR